MIFDRKISGFANVNRLIARVCGGGTLANMSRLRGALPEAKGKGGRMAMETEMSEHKTLKKWMSSICEI